MYNLPEILNSIIIGNALTVLQLRFVTVGYINSIGHKWGSTERTTKDVEQAYKYFNEISQTTTPNPPQKQNI